MIDFRPNNNNNSVSSNLSSNFGEIVSTRITRRLLLTRANKSSLLSEKGVKYETEMYLNIDINALIGTFITRSSAMFDRYCRTFSRG